MKSPPTQLEKLKDVEIFRAGVYRNKPYTLRDLDDIVQNFNKHSHLSKPPVVIGHESYDGVPSVGVVQHLKRQQDLLVADFGEVPRWMASLIRGKAYRRVSSEIYDAPPEGIPGRGKMLRRVALLGGGIPHIKTLRDLPLPEYESYAEAIEWPSVLTTVDAYNDHSSNAFIVFSEVRRMTRDEMVQQLQAKGFGESVLQEMTDNGLAECCRVYALPDLQQFKETAKTEIQQLLNSAVAEIKTSLTASKRDVEDHVANTRKARLESFCETRVKAGKISPAEMDRTGGKPNLFDRLMRADAKATVHKFSENGKEIDKTELDLQLEEIDARTPFFFGERLKSGQGENSDEEVTKVQRFVETNSSFVAALSAVGKTPKEYVTEFTEARKHDPTLTATQYGVPQ